MELVGTQHNWTRANGNTYKLYCKRNHPFDIENTYINPKSGKRTCKTCDRLKDRERFNRDPEAARKKQCEHMCKWRMQNREHNNKTWTELRRKKREWLDQYKQERGCMLCAESHIACLDFHHRDPSEKKFNLSVGIARASMDRLQAEVAKCDLICANCHRKLHWQERNSLE